MLKKVIFAAVLAMGFVTSFKVGAARRYCGLAEHRCQGTPSIARRVPRHPTGAAEFSDPAGRATARPRSRGSASGVLGRLPAAGRSHPPRGPPLPCYPSVARWRCVELGPSAEFCRLERKPRIGPRRPSALGSGTRWGRSPGSTRPSATGLAGAIEVPPVCVMAMRLPLGETPSSRNVPSWPGSDVAFRAVRQRAELEGTPGVAVDVEEPAPVRAGSVGRIPVPPLVSARICDDVGS